MAYTMTLHGLDAPGRKALARAALNGIETVTAGHGVPMAHPERLAIAEGYKVLEKGQSPGKIPIETYGSVGPDPDTHTPKANPRFKGLSARFQAQVALTLVKDRQARAAKDWHAKHLAAKGISCVETIERNNLPTTENETPSADVSFEVLRASASLYRSRRADTTIDSHGRVCSHTKQLSSSPAIFKIIE